MSPDPCPRCGAITRPGNIDGPNAIVVSGGVAAIVSGGPILRCPECDLVGFRMTFPSGANKMVWCTPVGTRGAS